MCKLIFDFDNTLISDDSLAKSFQSLNLRNKILILLLLSMRGKVYIKNYLWQNGYMKLNIKFNSNFLKLAVSRKAFIVSGSLDPFVKSVLLGIIPKKRIFGTKKINLTGRNKMKFLVKKFGHKKFDYIGDSFSDIHIWKAARNAYTVKRVGLYKLFVPHIRHINEL